MFEGWIKLHRKVMENEVFRHDLTAWHLFEVLLLNVDRTTGKWSGGRYQLVALCSGSIKPVTLYKALKRLEKSKMVTLVSNTKYTDIYICNWSEYQNVSNTSDEQRSNTSSNTPSNTLTRSKELRSKNKYNSELLNQIIEIINPREKPTEPRQRKLNGLLKNYSADEIIEASKAFSQSKWHKQNKQMSVDNLLAPSKFGRWYVQKEEAKTSDDEYPEADRLIEQYEKMSKENIIKTLKGQS